MKIGIILTPDERSKAYLQKIQSKNIKLDHYIFMNNKNNDNDQEFLDEEIHKGKLYGFDITKSIKKSLIENNVKYKEFNFVDINNAELREYVKKITCDYIVFTGGGILKDKILDAGKKFIHIHPGIVPEYRGSTCFYYSIINEKKVGVTAFIMDKTLDTGDIIYQKKFNSPNHKFLDNIFDPHVRSEVLLDILINKKLENHQFKTQNPSDGTTYYIIHPVLKHIAMLRCK